MKEINSILCVVDPDSNSEAALEQAVRIANDHQADITVVSVLNTTGMLGVFFHNIQEINKNLQEQLNDKRHTLENWLKKSEPNLKSKIA